MTSRKPENVLWSTRNRHRNIHTIQCIQIRVCLSGLTWGDVVLEDEIRIGLSIALKALAWPVLEAVVPGPGSNVVPDGHLGRAFMQRECA